jgi:hypothetical protein
MVFERIESLKREYTDKYVVVDGSRPELARFDGQVGLIKTVNMNGRALVEFQDYIANIGWYDIDLDFLKVVAKPEASAAAKVEKPAAKKAAPAEKAAAKPTSAVPAAAEAKKEPSSPGEKKLSPLELARMQGAAKREAGAVPAKPESAAPKAADGPSPSAAAAGAKKPSTADILAAARTKKAPPAAVEVSRDAALASSTAPAVAPPGPIAVESTAVTEHERIGVEPPTKPPKPKEASPAAVRTKLSTTAEKIAWCQTNDAGRNATQ